MAPVSIPRPDGSSVRIVEALVGDASGVVILSARHAQGAQQPCTACSRLRCGMRVTLTACTRVARLRS